MAKKQLKTNYAMALYIENGLMAAYSPKLGNIMIDCFEEDEIDFKASLQGDWVEYKPFKQAKKNYDIGEDKILFLSDHPLNSQPDGTFVRNISLNERKREFAVAMWNEKQIDYSRLEAVKKELSTQR